MAFKVGAQILTYGSTWDSNADTVRSHGRSGHPTSGATTTCTRPVATRTKFFEGWTTLAWAQATRARLGLLVGANTFRNRAGGQDGGHYATTCSHGRSILGGLRGGQHGVRSPLPRHRSGRTMGERMNWFESRWRSSCAPRRRDEVTHRSEVYHFDRSPPRGRSVGSGRHRCREGRKRRRRRRYRRIWQWFAPFDGVETFRHKDEVLRAHAATEEPRCDDDRAD
jgi:hypothetical protein